MVRDEYFPGTSIRIDRETPITDPNYGQDLCRALSQLRERRGDVRTVVSDPPVFQTQPTMSEPDCVVRIYGSMCRLPVEDFARPLLSLKPDDRWFPRGLH